MIPYRIAESNQLLIPTPVREGWETMTVEESRGIVWLFEEPRHDQLYIVGCDPAFGINGWDRTVPMDDQNQDNSAIEVFRISNREVIEEDKDGKKKTKFVPTAYQVAEYTAPVDYVETAAIVNLLGRLFKGKGRMGVAHTIIEVYPGNGWMIEKELISKYGYLNFYQPKYINTLEPKTATGIGWQANQKSVRDLWIMGTRQINSHNVIVRSPWLLNEMQTTEPIKFMSYTSEAESGFHDDRLRAMMLCLWAAFDFSSQVKVETKTTVERNSSKVNWQASDISSEKLVDQWEARFREIGNS